MSPRASQHPRTLLIGGGFAGLCAARRLAGTPAVTLVDERDAFEFLPNIHYA
jgi:NADH dehydrogenase FAD-containing subunit